MTNTAAKRCPECGEHYEADVLFCPRDGTPIASARNSSFGIAERDPYIGLDLGGQIRVTHLVGIGSMGRVYKAFQGGVDRDVAVKVLHRELSGNAELVSRFHREAKVSSRLVHPNVVQVLMTGMVPGHFDSKSGGELYLVMEYLDGISLLSALAAAGGGGEGNALPLPRALHIILQVCDAVGEAHAQNIVHRDLKPENIMLVRRGEDPDFVKVLDFGIARLNWNDQSIATHAGLIFGTAKYISPEGAEGFAVGPPADVYSIAVILYQCLAGKTPFDSDSHVGLLVQHVQAPPPPLTSIARAAYVPAPLSAVIMKNLSKKPSERAPDARALGREIIAAARESGLAPEEILSPSSLFAAQYRGAVRLASKERTKSLELGPDISSRIQGSIAPSPPASSSAAASNEGAQKPLAPAAPPPALGTPSPLPSSQHRLTTSSSDLRMHKSPAKAYPAPLSSESDSAHKSAPNHAPLLHQSQADLAAHQHLPSTIQGTESAVESGVHERPQRAQIARGITIAACLLAFGIMVVAGGRKLGAFGTNAPGDTLEMHLDDARDAMRRRAWDAPPESNVKAILERAQSRFPDDPRIKDLEREAAERLVNDALGRKYAGDKNEALRLAKLALGFSPGLATAQHLVAELNQQDAAPKGEAPALSSAASGAASKALGEKQRPPQTTRKSPENNVPKASEDTGAPTLPPQPPPLPTTDTPPPATTGPWL